MSDSIGTRLSNPYHLHLISLLYEMKGLKNCSTCGATYDNDDAENIIEEAWARRKAGDPGFAGLTLTSIRSEVERIRSEFGGHNNCWA